MSSGEDDGDWMSKAVEYSRCCARRHTYPPTVFTDMPRVFFSLCKFCDFNGATVALGMRRTIIMIISSRSHGDEWGRRIRSMMYRGSEGATVTSTD